MTLINCRAQIVDECYNGRDEQVIANMLGDPDYRMQFDGTWDRESKSIVCDACYVALMPHTPSGKALTDEIPAAIAKLRHTKEA